jgi:hypothetical protein
LHSASFEQPVEVLAQVPPAQAKGAGHAVRGARGTPSTSVHVPTLPDSAHASH